MKKVASLLVTVLFCAFAFACAAAPVVYTFDADKPWGGNNTVGAYEKCVYDIKIVNRVVQGKETVDGEVIANGRAEYVLTQKIDTDNVMYTTLSMTHTVTYDAEKAGTDSGCTDTVTSEVKFTTDGCGPVYSKKTEIYAPRKNSSGVFSDTVYDYEAEADYNTRKAVVKKNKSVGENGEKSDDYKSVTEFDILSGAQSFDNEQLYYVIRALTGTTPKGSQSLTITNLYEIPERIDKKGRYKNIGIRLSTAEELSVFTLDSAFAQKYLSPAENGEYAVNCMRTTITRNDTYSGPSFTMYMSEPSLKFERKDGDSTATSTSKVIVRMVRVNYDLNQHTEGTNIVYTLSDYSTERV